MFLNLAQKRLTTTFAIVSLLGTQPSSVVASLVARFHFFLSDFGQVTPPPILLGKYAPGNEHLIATYCIRRQQFGDGLVVLLSFSVRCMCVLFESGLPLFLDNSVLHTNTHNFTFTLCVIAVVVVVVP